MKNKLPCSMHELLIIPLVITVSWFSFSHEEDLKYQEVHQLVQTKIAAVPFDQLDCLESYDYVPITVEDITPNCRKVSYSLNRNGTEEKRIYLIKQPDGSSVIVNNFKF